MTHGKGNPLRSSIKKIRRVKKLQGGKPVFRKRKQVGPPKVGFQTVRGRRGQRVLIKRPSPRSV